MESNTLFEKAKEWLKLDKNPKTANEIDTFMKNNDTEALKKCLGKRMEFGTAGLRAPMGAGTAKMNDLTIIQTTQGFLKYLLTKFPDDLNSRGVLIGHDSRHNSKRFAALAATVFLSSGVKCYLYSKIVPTPFVAYGVTYFKTCAGIMVTASHNPKEDNGYKVYWDNGSQIIPPHDSGIASQILSNLVPWSDDIWKADTTSAVDPYDEIMINYFQDLKKLSIHSSVNTSSLVKFTYTPVHGVGLKFAEESFKTFQLQPFFATPEQMDPDPEFSTVKYPNPEEGKGVLTLAMKCAESNGCRVIVANDPDADRLAVAEQASDGTWKIFTGNELGALFGWWAFECYKRNTAKDDLKNVYMISSTVSSMILESMAHVEGFMFEDTLTGFKWMGNRSHDLMKEGKTVLFAFEEAIGYMFGTNVLDKDGVTACGVIAECVCWLESHNKTLVDALNDIYSTYGFHISNNSYYLCYDQEKLLSMFNRLRNYPGDDVIEDKSRNHRYPRKLDCYVINHVRDLTTGFDSRHKDGKATLPVSSSSQMLTFYFANGCTLTLRTSGTEPKIKYYTEMKGDARQKEELTKTLTDLVNKMCMEFYQPEYNGFLPKPSE